MKTFVCVFIGSTVLALAVTPFVIWLARRIKAVDRPGVRTVHERPTPRIGGVAIFLAAMCLIVCVLFLDNSIGQAFREKHVQLGSLLCTATFIFLIGLVDDVKGLPAHFKFLAEVAAAGVLCAVGIQIKAIVISEGLVLRLGVFAVPLTVLWIVGITNAVNLSDGLDGLAAGVSAVACAVIAIFAIHSVNRIMAVFMLAMLGSLSGFLFFNFNPAKIFMGDCGSLFLGYVIASASVLCHTNSYALVGLALPALALGIPIFDTFFSMLRRFLERRSLFAPDRSHFHHRLIDMGLTQRHAVLTIYAATFLAAGLGLFMMVREDLGSLVVFGCILVLVVLLFRVVGAVRFRETLLCLQQNHAFTRQQKHERKTFEQLQLRLRRTQGFAEWWKAICEAAEALGIAWVSLTVKDVDGSVDASVWREPETPTNDVRLVTMTMPIIDSKTQRSLEFEIAIKVNGSLESASHRAGLFGRLVDECNLIWLGPTQRTSFET
jgi:UDP-GlcNAc:undecaprenyl-phosphate GlcNAc-1-phosphate transferase